MYGSHGIGRIAAREKQLVLGTSQEVLVIELENGLTVTLPLKLAEGHLRASASEADLDRVRETLRDDRELSVDPWLSRRRQTLERLTAADPVQLAEIVSEGAQRERIRRAKGGKAQLSQSERDIFVKARKLLSGEIALALGVQPSDADSWIEEHLTRPV